MAAIRVALVLARLSLLEAWRARVFLLAGVLLAASAGAAAFASALAITESGSFAVSVYAGAARIALAALVAVHVAGAAARELADEGLLLVLALPVHRSAWFAGRLLGAAAAAAALALLAFPLLLVTAAPPAGAAAWTLGLWAELLVVATLALTSMLALRTLPAALAAVAATYLLGRSLSALVLIGRGSLLETDALAEGVARVLDVVTLFVPRLDRVVQSSWLQGSGPTSGDLQAAAVEVLLAVGLYTSAGLVDLRRRSF